MDNIYYFLSNKFIFWQGETQRANLLRKPPPEFESGWEFGKSLPITYEFHFSIKEGAQLPDNYWTGSYLYPLYSQKLISIFRDTGVIFDLFSTKMFLSNSGSIIELGYQVFRLNEITDCLDKTKSEYKIWFIGNRQMKSLIKPVFTHEFLNSNKMLTRIAGDERLIVIHSDLRKILDEEKIIGCDFKTERLREKSIFEE